MKVGIAVTSFELDRDRPTPILTHIFWGSTLKEAFGYAKSHLITDYFFSSSFIGEMEWKGKPLKLDYQGQLIGVKQVQLSDLLEKLQGQAEELRKVQEDTGFVDCFNDLVSQLD